MAAYWTIKRSLPTLILALLTIATAAPAAEFRALWADAFHTGFRTPSQVSQLVADARRGNFNTILVQVRKRGDAYYNSTLEPKATDVSPQSFDPLADLIAKANSGPQPIEIHAWIVTYKIWNRATTAPPQSTHPFRLHPDWLTQKFDDTTSYDGANHAFDPGHPAVQQHTFDVCMDIVSRYPVDGLHFDYIRYSEHDTARNKNPWGYNPVAVARFNHLHHRTGKPEPTDPAWLQFRRDQVTQLVRKVYLNTWAVRPACRVSAATITFSSPPTSSSAAAFSNTDAYARVLQDWRAWTREGILDLNIPMNYRDQATRASDYATWNARIAAMQFNRSSAAGLAFYLNTTTDTTTQIRNARNNNLSGIAGFSYAVTNDSGDSRATFLDTLTSPQYFPGPDALPPMPWKADPSIGNLMGTVTDATTGLPADGATVTVTGPSPRILTTDATGFYGTLALPPGNYTARITHNDLSTTSSFTITGTKVTANDINLRPAPFLITSITYDRTELAWQLTWPTIPNRTYTIQTSPDLKTWIPLATNLPHTTTTYTDYTASTARSRHYRVLEIAN